MPVNKLFFLTNTPAPHPVTYWFTGYAPWDQNGLFLINYIKK
jgi:hypothetical protein